MRLTLPLLVFLIVLGGCRDEPPGGMSREKFVRVNVALRLVPDSAPGAAEQRTAILRRERVTPGQLETWVKANADDDALMVAWRDIAARVDSATRPRRGPPGAAGDSAPPGPDARELDGVLRRGKPPRPDSASNP